MGKKSGPAPPDPVKTAQAQGVINRDTAIAQRDLNMFDQSGPYGSLAYTPIEGGETESGIQRYQATQTLSPDQQRMLDLSNQAAIRFGEVGTEQLDKVGGRLADPLDFSSLGPAPIVNEETRQNTRDAILGRLAPIHEQDRSRLETNLANQGIQSGSEAWRRGIDDYNRMITDARLAADAQSGNEMARMYGLEANQRDRAINEMVQQRQLPLNELISLTQGQQVQNPRFVNTPQGQINPANYQDAAYRSFAGEQQRQNMRNQFNNAMMGGLFGLGGSGITAYGLNKLGGNKKQSIS